MDMCDTKKRTLCILSQTNAKSVDAVAAKFDYFQFIHAHQMKWCNIQENLWISIMKNILSFTFFVKLFFVDDLSPTFVRSFCNVRNFSKNMHTHDAKTTTISGS